MGIARELLLRASRSEWLKEQFRRRAFAQRAVGRFMPGEKWEDAARAAARFASQKIGAVLTNLGEQVTSREEADAVRDHYLRVLDELAARKLNAEISVKLTHLGLDIDELPCLMRVQALARHAAETGSFLWIDMEESTYVDRTLEIYRQARRVQDRVGVCLQAYLKRTPGDLDGLLSSGGSVRLVKGAYQEPATIAYQGADHVTTVYGRLAQTMLGHATPGGSRAVFGTHDMTLIEAVRQHATSRNVPAAAWEVHMLYGIRTDDQRRLAARGVTVKVLISYGTHWFPWYMRRLAEKPSNVFMILRNLLG